MKLSNFLSLFATGVAMFACEAFALMAVTFGGLHPAFLLATIPAGLIAYLASLPFAHWSAQPFEALAKRTRLAQQHAKEENGPIDTNFRLTNASSGIDEAEELAKGIDELMDASKATYEELEHLHRAQDRFVADISHELRTPLTAISGNAEILMDPDMPADMRNHFCEIILSESDRMTNLVNDLLEIERIRRGAAQERERLDLGEVASDVVDIMSALAREQGVSLAFEGSCPAVMGSPERTRQVLINLVDNALHHVDEGGHVTIHLSTGEEGKKAVIAVVDDGCGLGDVDPKLLFERLYRTDASRARRLGGNGLGLAIVNEIVTAMDGTITARNAEGRGATFEMTLPACK